MKKIITFLFFFSTLFILYGNPKVSLQTFTLNKENLANRQEKSPVPWLQLGFRIGYNFSLMNNYSATDEMKKLFCGEFNTFVRFGKHVYFETGIGYFFHKGHYNTSFIDPPVSNEIVETRFLQVPMKVVGFYGFKEKYGLFTTVGALYQPLIQVSKNYIDYSLENITRHQFLFSTSIGTRISFLTIEVGYRKLLTPFFTDRKSNKPDFLSLMIGFMF